MINNNNFTIFPNLSKIRKFQENSNFIISPNLSKIRKFKKMRKIEQAPKWQKKRNLEEGLKHFIDKESQALINEINDKYLYWDKVKYKTTTKIEDPEVLWTAVKFSRSIHAKYLELGKYSFTYNLTDSIQKSLHKFDLNIGGQLGAKSIIPDENKERYLISSIMEEAIASSQIEGAVTTRKKAKEMLRKNTKPRTKSEQMIMNNYLTIKRIVDIQDQPLTKELLFDIHKLITSQTLDSSEDEGRYRTTDDVNVVDVMDGEIIHTPPGYIQIPSLMDELFIFFNSQDDKQFIHPIIKGCIIHFLVGFFHPFVDGNGRTARALFYWYLLKNGYWLTEYLSISRMIVKSKAQYAMAYIHTEVDENDLTYFIQYKLKTMKLAFESLREYIQRKIKEKKTVFDFQRISGINERQALILKWLYGEPDKLVTVKEVEIRLRVSNQTGRTDLYELKDLGYLDPVDINKKTKAFCKSSEFEELLKNALPRKAHIV
jgi:Fic family protein